MQTSPFPPQTETPDETFLRLALQAHAPKAIDVESAWSRVAEQITSTGQISKRPKSRWLRFLGASGRQHAERWRRAWITAAVVALSLLFIGAGFAGGRLYFWGGPFGDPGIQLIGDEHLYQDIEQQQQVHQVTITVTKAYADTGRTLIAYDLQVPASIAQRYNSVFVASYSLTDQEGEEPAGGNTECTAFPHDGSPMHCLIMAPAFHPAAGVSQLTITLDIIEVYLIRADSTGTTDTLSGPWRFQFTLPMHQQNLGTGGPYAQPTQKP